MIQASLPYAYTYPPVYWGSGGAYYGSAGYGNPAYVAYQRTRGPGSFWGWGHAGPGAWADPYLHGSLGYPYGTRLNTAGRTTQRGSNVAPALTSYAQLQDRQYAALREQYRHSHQFSPQVYNYLMRSHLPTIKGGFLHQAIGVRNLTNHYYGQAGVNYIDNRLSRAALNTATAHLARKIRPVRGRLNNAGGHLAHRDVPAATRREQRTAWSTPEETGAGTAGARTVQEMAQPGSACPP